MLAFIYKEEELHIFNLSLGYVASSCHVHTNRFYKKGEISAAKYSGTNSLAFFLFFFFL